jgi:hypothetical protein
MCWVRDIESLAEVAEVIGCGGTLGERACVPLPHKVQEIDGHRAEVIVTDQLTLWGFAMLETEGKDLDENVDSGAVSE